MNIHRSIAGRLECKLPTCVHLRHSIVPLPPQKHPIKNFFFFALPCCWRIRRGVKVSTILLGFFFSFLKPYWSVSYCATTKSVLDQLCTWYHWGGKRPTEQSALSEQTHGGTFTYLWRRSMLQLGGSPSRNSSDRAQDGKTHWFRAIPPRPPQFWLFTAWQCCVGMRS